MPIPVSVFACNFFWLFLDPESISSTQLGSGLCIPKWQVNFRALYWSLKICASRGVHGHQAAGEANWSLTFIHTFIKWMKSMNEKRSELHSEWRSGVCVQSARNLLIHATGRTGGRGRGLHPPNRLALSSSFWLIIESIERSGPCMSQVLRTCCMQTTGHTHRTPCNDTIHVSRDVSTAVFLLLSLLLADITQLWSRLFTVH